MKASAAVVLFGAILFILRWGNAQKWRQPYKDDYNKDNHNEAYNQLLEEEVKVCVAIYTCKQKLWFVHKIL